MKNSQICTFVFHILVQVVAIGGCIVFVLPNFSLVPLIVISVVLAYTTVGYYESWIRCIKTNPGTLKPNIANLQLFNDDANKETIASLNICGKCGAESPLKLKKLQTLWRLCKTFRPPLPLGAKLCWLSKPRIFY